MNRNKWDDLDDYESEEDENFIKEADYFISDDNIAEVETLVSLIRSENTNDKLTIQCNEYFQIELVYKLNNIETMFSVVSAMECIKDIQKQYLFNYESSFEIIMGKNPTIYCIFEQY
jgi:hypothetical protein